METGANNFQSLEGLDIGMSINGIANYLEELKANVLEKAKSALRGDQLQRVVTIINQNWQGASRDRFLNDLDVAITNISNDLDAEYADLIARLEEIKNNYIRQDNEMMF